MAKKEIKRKYDINDIRLLQKYFVEYIKSCPDEIITFSISVTVQGNTDYYTQTNKELEEVIRFADVYFNKAVSKSGEAVVQVNTKVNDKEVTVYHIDKDKNGLDYELYYTAKAFLEGTAKEQSHLTDSRYKNNIIYQAQKLLNQNNEMMKLAEITHSSDTMRYKGYNDGILDMIKSLGIEPETVGDYLSYPIS